MYNTTWACPPAVGTVEECKARCLSYPEALMMTSITEVSDIANLEETLATRGPHEELTRQVRDMIAAQGVETRVLSTEACAICRALRLPGRTVPSPRTECSPAWRARAFWSPTLPKSTVWIL